ncbi:hypothetical protein HHK36_024861 [Tetracentron sinense]|uniref:Uncharacterized protein n=1 Tax=Tetracentron sinense TaxID=13715 RepID=A0A834YRJ0_TETSI|nr:hypothetical protein HHK36_024861 [Tetracentron sinense]
MERNNSYGASWADQWDYSNPDPVPEQKSSGATAKYGKKLGVGFGKTKEVTSTGMKKMKEGTSKGLQWIKDKVFVGTWNVAGRSPVGTWNVTGSFSRMRTTFMLLVM